MSVQFKNVFGNPDEANIFLLGDIHTDKTHAGQRRSIFEQYAKPGDIVLFESRQQFYNLDPNHFKETKGLPVVCMGWDSESHVKILKEITRDQRTLVEAAGSSPHVDRLTQEIAYRRFIKLEKNFNEGNLQRDKCLLETVLKLREMHPEKRIFVRGGDQHILSKLVQWGLRDEKTFTATFVESDDQESLDSYYDRLFSTDRAPLAKVSAPTTVSEASDPAFKVQKSYSVRKVALYAAPVILATALAYYYTR